MRLLLVGRIFNNVAGGIEKMISTIANEMSRRGHQVYIYTWDVEGAINFYPIDRNIHWIKMNEGDFDKIPAIMTRLKRYARTRRVITDIAPDVVVAFQAGVFLHTAIPLLFTRIPLVAAERESPWRYDFLHARKWRALLNASFILSHALLVQFPSYKYGYPVYLRKKIKSIPNPVRIQTTVKARTVKKTVYHVLAVGRLSFQKNFELLINAIAHLNKTESRFKLKIIGEGEQREGLEKLISTLKLTNDITIHKNQKSLDRMYEDADIFCIPSRWEGFPNVLAEALSFGLPAVGLKSCRGVSDLIKEGVNGTLVESTSFALAEGINDIVKNEERLNALSRGAIESMRRYEFNHVLDQWEIFFRAYGMNSENTFDN
jgi:GalNAc-alpha-(1->4)-GalNAc-alpha-(1->3)-diNAcBac-PP-undecaprenol alpha-1,4-N-acetyl-D-galactosaminyltransferase